MDVRTQTLRYFVAVAEEMSFSAAAERLGVSQPAVSRQVRLLEEQIQAPLFARNTRDVRLTAAGGALLEPARQTLLMWEKATRLARTASALTENRLRVGCPSPGLNALMAKAAGAFGLRFAPVLVQPHTYQSDQGTVHLRQGTVDAAFLWLPADTTGLVVEVIAEEARMLGVAEGHPLACRDRVTLADLGAEAWRVNGGALPATPWESDPLCAMPSGNVEELLENVASGGGMCVLPQSVARLYQRPDLCWKPLADAPPQRIGLAWPAESPHSLVRDFADVVLRLGWSREPLSERQSSSA
ncbi:LysR family transcriptional regulator [Streptomyces sp. WELS2]|uniref:LysR family transcriptional regulator n=1 Tax=Streptomyces sp. WELS2 TaxID=2749435 RepID=UPI0015EFE92F|nr:LysR family transcriptional regulator [Streptomyces sp. WELS2]